MKAWFTVPGPDGATFELRDIPVPVAGPGQVLVLVRAAGTNRGELIRGAALRSGPTANPARSGGEFAGEVASVGDGVGGYTPGDRVMGRTAGSYAEYVVASSRALMRIPDGLGWAEAAAIPNVFVTAHDAIVTNGATAAGESVMVTAGPSGVGTAAIQIARHLGANPVLATTRSPAKTAAIVASCGSMNNETRMPALCSSPTMRARRSPPPATSRPPSVVRSSRRSGTRQQALGT